MSEFATSFAAIVAEAVESGQLDDTKVTSGGPRRLPAAGLARARFVEYIELGKQQQRAFEGKPKAPAMEVKLTFELLTPARPKANPPFPGHVEEVDTAEGKKKIADRISITIVKSGHEKSKYAKLFKAMRAGRDIKAMAQMMGEPFLLNVAHVTSKAGREYATFYVDGVWKIQRNIVEDPETGDVKEIAVAPVVGEMRGLLWDHPTKAHWDGLFIKGDREIEKDGKKVTVSNNFIQAKILGAVNFGGSPLEALLVAEKIDIDALRGEVPDGDDAVDHTDEEAEEQEKPKAEEQEKPKAESAAEAKKATASKVAAAEDDDEAAARALLGL